MTDALPIGPSSLSMRGLSYQQVPSWPRGNTVLRLLRDLLLRINTSETKIWQQLVFHQKNKTMNNKPLRIYSVLADRFKGNQPLPPGKSINSYMGGNLEGIMDKLPYIKEQGFNAILLSPVFQGAAYHGYHPINFDQIDPHFGTWEILQSLIDTAHGMGISVFIDIVCNHVHKSFPLFQEALNGDESKQVLFHFNKDGSYVSFMGIEELPKWNLSNRQASNYVISKMARLAEMGADGFRIDHAIGLPHPFLGEIKNRLKEINRDIFIFGEVWAGGIDRKHFGQLYFKDRLTRLGYERKGIDQESIQLDYSDVLDGVLDFRAREIILQHAAKGQPASNRLLREQLISHFKKYSPEFQPVLFLDNFDTNRIMFECGNNPSAVLELVRMLGRMNRPLVISYGTEILMTHRESIQGPEAEPYSDLNVRLCMDWTKQPIHLFNNNHQQKTGTMPITSDTSWEMTATGCNTYASENMSEDKDSGSASSLIGKIKAMLAPQEDTSQVDIIWKSSRPEEELETTILPEETHRKLFEITSFIMNREHIKSWGGDRFMKKKALIINLHGESGTGKTTTAEAVANACGMDVIQVSMSALQSELWGGTEKNLTKLLSDAEKQNAAVIINEADAMFCQRKSDGANAETNNQIRNHLLDSLDKHKTVIFLTTNRLEQYDKAFARRIAFHVDFPMPGIQELVQLIKYFLGCEDEERFCKGGVIPKTDSFDYEKVAHMAEGLSGGDIRQVTINAIAKLLASNNKILTEEIMHSVIEDYKKTKALLSASPNTTRLDGEDRDRVRRMADEA